MEGGDGVKLIYEGTDMGGYANVIRCVHRAYAHGRADSLELEVDHAAAWYRWKPKKDDAIVAERDGYSTGRMYLNSMVPEGDRFRIVASSLPAAARRVAWQGYENETLSAIMHRCAAECGMGEGIYGLDGDVRYRYMLRRNEGSAAFLERLCRMEGMALMALNGAFRALSVAWAQRRAASVDLWIDTDQPEVTHRRQPAERASALTVYAPGIRVTARDSLGISQNTRSVALPATDAAQAGRWARGLLLMENRECERVTMKSAFNAAMKPMVRAQIEGPTDATGSWLVDSVEQDLKDGGTEAVLLRCVESIA